MTIEAVSCEVCHKLYRKADTNYIRLVGSLYIGYDGGVFGPNVDIALCFYCLQLQLIDLLKEPTN